MVPRLDLSCLCHAERCLPIRRDITKGLEGLDQPRNLLKKPKKPVLLVDEESVSSKDEGVTKVKAFIAIAEEEPSVGKNDARSGQRVIISMKNVQRLFSMIDGDERRHVLDYSHVDLHYVKDQRKNLLSMFNSLNQELSSSDVLTLANVSLTLTVSEEIRKVPEKRSAVKAPKEKAQTMSPSASDPIPVKKADSSTKKLLLNLMEEVKGKQKTWFGSCKHCGFRNHILEDCYMKPKCSMCGSTNHLTKEHPEQAAARKNLAMLKAQSSHGSFIRKEPMIPKPFDWKYCGFNDYHFDECEYYPGYDIYGSIAHETTYCTKKPASTKRKPRVACQQSNNLQKVKDFRIADDQVSSIIEPISNVEPSPTIISPSAKVFINPPVLQDRWSTKKHIELVNILGEPQVEVTTRIRIRDSKAASVHECLYVNFLSKIKPKKLIKALKVKGWMIAMQEELNQFERNKMGKHWVVVKNKARMVAQGYNQQEEIDYDKTFTHVARLKAIRIFLVYAAYIGPNKSGVTINETLFRSMIGSLMYLTASRPDIQFSTCLCARPLVSKRIRLQSEIIFRLRLRWMQPRQKEYLRGLSNTWWKVGILECKEAKLSGYVPIFCDNTSATAISNNPVLHCRTKHIDIRYHFIRDHILKGDIELHFVPTELQLAKILIKPLAKSSFTRLVAKLGMLNIEKELNINQQMISYGLCWGLDIDIAGILFSDLVTKLITRKKGRDQNICFTRYLSLIIEHLLGDAYINENLKTIKPHHITALTFKPSTASEVSLTSYMRKVAKLFEQPKKPLILPSKEVNTDTTTDKSLFETCVQLGAQSKARIDKKSKKKRNFPSSKPKTSKIVKDSSPSTQVADTQNAKEPVTTTDATKGLVASESKEEQGNQPKTVDAEKVPTLNIKDTTRNHSHNSQGKSGEVKGYPRPNRESKSALTFLYFMYTLSLYPRNDTYSQGSLTKSKESQEKEVDDEFTDSRISSLGNVTFEELHGNAEESPYNTESEIKVVKRFNLQHSDADDQIKFIGPVYSDMEDDTEAHSDGIEITLTDSSKDARVVEADFALESMLGDETESVSGFKTTKTEDDDTHSQYKEDLSKSEEMVADNILDELANMANSYNTEINASAKKSSLLDPFGHLYKDLSSLTSMVEHLESSLAQ
nr:hypothetical protein [Tanacetum cinerariifolium]